MKEDENDARNGSNREHTSHTSHKSQPPERLLPPRGDYRTLLSFQKAEIIYDLNLCLIHQTDYLIDRQLRRLENDFIEQGGLRERMTRLRLQHRNARPGP